jgi:hypothetical protein
MKLKEYFNLMKDLPCRYDYARGGHAFSLTTYISTNYHKNSPVIYFGGEYQDFDDVKAEDDDEGRTWRFFNKGKELSFAHMREHFTGGSWPGLRQSFLFCPTQKRGAVCESIDGLENALNVYDIEYVRTAETIFADGFMVCFVKNYFGNTSIERRGLYFEISKEIRKTDDAGTLITHEHIFNGYI